MNQRENLLAIFRREPFEWLPAEFNLCPSLEEEYKRRTGSHLPYQEYFEMPWRNAPDIQIPFFLMAVRVCQFSLSATVS